METVQEKPDEVWPPLSQRQRTLYELLFYSQGPVDGYILGEGIQDFFLKSGLSLTVLSQIWNLADVSNDNVLNVHEFALVMHLTRGAKQGLTLPKTLPRSLTPPKTPPVPLPAMSQAEKLAYHRVFQSLDRDKSGVISGQTAADVLASSQLTSECLVHIWDLSDLNRDGKLGADEFSIACHLTRAVKTGLSLTGPADVFQYVPDKISPASLLAKKRRLADYEKHKQKLMSGKERRKLQSEREAKRLKIATQKVEALQELLSLLTKFGKNLESQTHIAPVLSKESSDVTKQEEIVLRLKKEHEKVRQETVKVILGEQKLNSDISVIKRETDILNKRLMLTHTPATKDPDPFHQLYEQRREKRQGSTIKDLDKIDTFIPFEFSPFDLGITPDNLPPGAAIFDKGNNHRVADDQLAAVVADLKEFGEEFMETWAPGEHWMDGGDFGEDDIFKEVHDWSEDNWPDWDWSSSGLFGLTDQQVVNLKFKLADLREELKKLNSEGGRLVFRNPDDYNSRQLARQEEAKTRVQRRSVTDRLKSSSGSRQRYSYSGQRSASVDTTSGSYRHNRRSQNLTSAASVPESSSQTSPPELESGADESTPRNSAPPDRAPKADNSALTLRTSRKKDNLSLELASIALGRPINVEPTPTPVSAERAQLLQSSRTELTRSKSVDSQLIHKVKDVSVAEPVAPLRSSKKVRAPPPPSTPSPSAALTESFDSTIGYSLVGHTPPKVNQAPPITNQAPPTANQAPLITNQAPPITNQAPPITNQAPPITNQAPPTANQAPLLTNQAPPIPNQALPITNQAPPITNQAPPITNQAPPIINQAPPPASLSQDVLISDVRSLTAAPPPPPSTSAPPPPPSTAAPPTTPNTAAPPTPPSTAAPPTPPSTAAPPTPPSTDTVSGTDSPCPADNSQAKTAPLHVDTEISAGVILPELRPQRPPRLKKRKESIDTSQELTSPSSPLTSVNQLTSNAQPSTNDNGGVDRTQSKGTDPIERVTSSVTSGEASLTTRADPSVDLLLELNSRPQHNLTSDTDQHHVTGPLVPTVSEWLKQSAVTPNIQTSGSDEFDLILMSLSDNMSKTNRKSSPPKPSLNIADDLQAAMFGSDVSDSDAEPPPLPSSPPPPIPAGGPPRGVQRGAVGEEIIVEYSVQTQISPAASNHVSTGSNHVSTGSNHVPTGSNHVSTGSNHVSTGSNHVSAKAPSTLALSTEGKGNNPPKTCADLRSDFFGLTSPRTEKNISDDFLENSTGTNGLTKLDLNEFKVNLTDVNVDLTEVKVDVRSELEDNLDSSDDGGAHKGDNSLGDSGILTSSLCSTLEEPELTVTVTRSTETSPSHPRTPLLIDIPTPHQTPHPASPRSQELVERARQFADMVQPRIVVKREGQVDESLSPELLHSLELQRRAVISQSTVKRRVSTGLSPSAEMEGKMFQEDSVSNKSSNPSEYGYIYSAERPKPPAEVGWSDKQADSQKVNLYSENVVKEGETTEAVDRESIANLSTTKKQWETIFTSHDSTKGESTLKKKSTPKWEVRLPYKEKPSAPVVSNQDTPPEQHRSEPVVMASKPLDTESAIDREIRLAHEREEMLRKEKEQRQKMAEKQPKGQGQTIIASYEAVSAESEAYQPAYNELTEADRGPELWRGGTNGRHEEEEEEETEEDVNPNESIIEREIRLQREREAEIAKMRQQGKPNHQVEQHNKPHHEEVSDVNHNHKTHEEESGESLIARELRELREREEEMKRMRSNFQGVHINDELDGRGQSSLAEHKPTSLAVTSHITSQRTPSPGHGTWQRDVSPFVSQKRRGSQDSNSSQSTGRTPSDSTPSRNIRVQPILDDGDKEETKDYFKKQETPIEREMRLARERENELRRSKGLPELTPDNDDFYSSYSPGQEPSDNGSVSRPRSSGQPGDSMKKIASSRLQQELMQQKERELALRSEGKILSTSEEHIEPLRYTDIAGVERADGKEKRNFVTKRSSVIYTEPESTLPQEVTSPNSQPTKKLGAAAGGQLFSYKEFKQTAESKIERELREMREREEELRKQRKENAGDSPR